MEGRGCACRMEGGNVIKLPKKGDLSNCNNYRGIMLSVGKVLNRILLERMKEAVDPMLRDQQEQVLCRSDHKLAHHSGAIARVEFFPLCELH